MNERRTGVADSAAEDDELETACRGAGTIDAGAVDDELLDDGVVDDDVLDDELDAVGARLLDACADDVEDDDVEDGAELGGVLLDDVADGPPAVAGRDAGAGVARGTADDAAALACSRATDSAETAAAAADDGATDRRTCEVGSLSVLLGWNIGRARVRRIALASGRWAVAGSCSADSATGEPENKDIGDTDAVAACVEPSGVVAPLEGLATDGPAVADAPAAAADATGEVLDVVAGAADGGETVAAGA